MQTKPSTKTGTWIPDQVRNDGRLQTGLTEAAQRILAVLEELKPDILLLTGDYIQWDGGHGEALDFLSRLESGIAIYAVMGDYDYSNSRKSCLFCHEPGSGRPTNKHRVTFLRNTVEPLDLPGGRVWVAGLDPVREEGSGIKRVLKDWKDKEPMILLSHSPLNFDFLDEKQDVLMLSGDTHGGQIPLPSWVWKVLGYEKNARYGEGLFEKGGKKMFVSRGVGTSHVPFRLLRRPEVVVIGIHDS